MSRHQITGIRHTNELGTVDSLVEDKGNNVVELSIHVAAKTERELLEHTKQMLDEHFGPFGGDAA